MTDESIKLSEKVFKKKKNQRIVDSTEDVE